MRKRLCLVFLGAASVAACDIGNPGVRAGGSELEFGTLELLPGSPAPQPMWRITRYLGSPFFQWNHRDWELVGPPLDSPPMPPFDLPAFPLDSPNGPIVRYSSNNAFWTLMPGDPASNTPPRELWSQHETLLFARDPEELYDRLYGLVGPGDFKNATFLPKWRGEWTPERTPMAPSVFFPPQPNWNTVASSAEPFGDPLPPTQVHQNDFWGNVVPAGPGAMPTGHGSIKGAKVIEHGLCSKFIPYVGGNCSSPPCGLLQQIDAKLFSGIAASQCYETVKRFANFSPFLHSPDDREDAQYGGFFFNASIQINAILGGGPNLLLFTANPFRLFDGRLTVEPQVVFSAADGTGGDGARLSLDQFMGKGMSAPVRANDIARPQALAPQTFSETLWQAADDAQIFQQPFPFACSQVTLGEEAVPVVDPMTDCGGYVNQVATFVDGALSSSYDALNAIPPQASSVPALTPADRAQIRNTVVAGEPNPRVGFAYKNFRCVDRGAGPKCEYIVRAKRVNVLPDGVELVFVDDRREPTNPAWPIWLFAWSQHRPNDPSSPLFGLCDAPVQNSPLVFKHNFMELETDCVKFTCNNGVVTSTPQQSCPL